VFDVLRPDLPAGEALDILVAASKEWAGVRGCADDLTALVLRAR
jgi:hypothetical protein